MACDWATADTRIFVSYSHKDRKHLEGATSLGSYLSSLERSGVCFWSDKGVDAGGDWDATIRGRLNDADIALVLVSQWLLNSTYVRRVEIPAMLERGRRHGLAIVPVMLSPSDWKQEGWLLRLQHKPEGDRTLADFKGAAARQRAYLDIQTWLRGRIKKGPAERAIEAMSGAVNVINSLEPEYRALLSGGPATNEFHSLHFEGLENEVRIIRHGVLEKTLTPADLSLLTLTEANDIARMQQEMRSYYEIWFELYRRRNEPGVDAQLRQLASDLKPKVLTLIERLVSHGLDLEDHYQYFYDFLDRLTFA